MSVIIMHPKHNLEMKYKKWGDEVCVCVCVWGLCSSSAAAARLNAKFQIMKYYENVFSLGKHSFQPSGNY